MKKNSNTLFKFAIFLVILVISIGSYVVDAYSNSDWNVHFANLSYEGDGNAKLVNGGLGIDFDCNLAKPNDVFIITLDVVNHGNSDAVVSVFKLLGITDKNDKFLNFSVTYSDGTEIFEGDLLKNNDSKSIKIIIAYELDKDIEIYELPNANTKFDLGLELVYSQKID